MCDLFVFKKKSYASLAGKSPEGLLIVKHAAILSPVVHDHSNSCNYYIT